MLTYYLLVMVTSNRQDDVFDAISHPARRQMLDLLSRQEHSVNAIAGHFEMSRPAVSQHLKVLLEAGLVAEERQGRERRYRFVPEQLSQVRDWIALYDKFWEDRLGRLQKLMARKKSK